MWRKDKYYVLHGMTLNWWFTVDNVVLWVFINEKVDHMTTNEACTVTTQVSLFLPSANENLP